MQNIAIGGTPTQFVRVIINGAVYVPDLSPYFTRDPGDDTNILFDDVAAGWTIIVPPDVVIVEWA